MNDFQWTFKCQKISDLYEGYRLSEYSAAHERFLHLANHYAEMEKGPCTQFKRHGVPSNEYATATVIFGGLKYIPSCLVLADGLKDFSTYDRVLMVEEGMLSSSMIDALLQYYSTIYEIPLIGRGIEAGNTKHAQCGKYQDLGLYSSKISVVNLLDYEKVLFLDATNLIFPGYDSLFSLPAPAAPMVPSAIEFRGYFFLVKPSSNLYKRLKYLTAYYNELFIAEQQYYDGGPDEVLLRGLFYNEWNFFENIPLDERWILAPSGFNGRTLVKQHWRTKPWEKLTTRSDLHRVRDWLERWHKLKVSNPAAIDLYKSSGLSDPLDSNYNELKRRYSLSTQPKRFRIGGSASTRKLHTTTRGYSI